MPVGIDDISAIAGIITGCVTLVQGCVKGFVLLQRARVCGRHISNIHLNFELEELKLYCWAEQVGLFEKPPQLRLATPIAECVPRVLCQLQSLLTDTRQLHSKYGLDLEETSEELTEIQADDSAFTHLQLTRLPEIQRLNGNVSKIFKTKITPWRRLKWVTVDEVRYQDLLTDVARLTGHLYQLSTLVQQRSLQNTFDILYRTAVMKTDSPQNLNVLIQSCQESILAPPVAPARLKKNSILSGILRKVRPTRSESEESKLLIRRDSDISCFSSVTQGSALTSSKEDKSRRLRIRHLTLPDNIQAHATRQLAYYEDKPILIEWRHVDRYHWEKWEERASRFCDILDEMAREPSFHSLPCRGFVKETETGRYGYVFELQGRDDATVLSTTSTNLRNRRLPFLRTLKDLIRQSTSMPSFNTRLGFAIVLLETILQLHTAEWLHKELRPENILLVASSGDAFLNEDLLCSPMYLAGYVYARADDPREFTEPLRPAAEADLYRHPLSLLGSERRSYCRSFDVFSTGCILLELALWSNMSDIVRCFPRVIGRSWRENFTPQPSNMATPPHTPNLGVGDQHEQDESTDLQVLRGDLLTQLRSVISIPGGILEHIKAQVGQCFANVIAEFLNVKISGWDAEGGMDESEYILDIEKRALDQFRGLAERL